MCKTIQELEAMQAKKFATHYGVKAGNGTKDVDVAKRTVQSIPNTYLFFDSDYDVLLPGCAKKTISERGPESTGEAKIKNVKDHRITERIGKPTLLDERTIDSKKVMYGESKMLTTTLGNDTLIEYQEGVIDQHSIGFRYLDMEYVNAEAKNWKDWLAKLVNPEKAEAAGFMFLVKEIEMYEWSPVSFGANCLTPYLGVKRENKLAVTTKLFDRLDLLEKQLRSGKQSDWAMLDYELETRQLKQIITELMEQEPSMKDTLLAQGRRSEDTPETKTSNTICIGCLRSFEYSKEPEAGMGYVKCPGCGQFCNQQGAMHVEFDLSKAIKETSFFKSNS